MKIENEIQQSRFSSSYHKASLNLIFTAGWLRDKIKCIVEKEKITNQQFNILRILRGSYPRPISTLQIRERMLDKMSDTSRLVDRLIEKGHVKKITCKYDRRMVDVMITDKGMQLLKKLDAQQKKFDNLLAGLSEQEVNTLNKLLDKVRENND